MVPAGHEHCKHAILQRNIYCRAAQFGDFVLGFTEIPDCRDANDHASSEFSPNFTGCNESPQVIPKAALLHCKSETSAALQEYNN